MTVFLALLLAHLLYDFHWQGPFIAENKGKRPFLLMVHALTWALLLSAVLYGFGMATPLKMMMMFGSHLVIDYWKSHQGRERFWLIYVDQGLHLMSIIAVAVMHA